LEGEGFLFFEEKKLEAIEIHHQDFFGREGIAARFF
jgi:hypothetical protein